jgi:hypothetical protein
LSWATGPEPPPDGGYNQNNAVAVAGSSVFVIETFGQRVQKFNTSSSCRSAGNCPAWQLQFGSREPPGAQSKGFAYPRGLAYGSGYLWVGDTHDAQAWTTDGVFVHRFGSAGTAVGSFKGGGLGIAAPGDGNVYTTDTGNCRLQVFTVSSALNQATPAPTEYMGTCGSGSNQMSAPRSIAVKGSTAWIAGRREQPDRTVGRAQPREPGSRAAHVRRRRAALADRGRLGPGRDLALRRRHGEQAGRADEGGWEPVRRRHERH